MQPISPRIFIFMLRSRRQIRNLVKEFRYRVHVVLKAGEKEDPAFNFDVDERHQVAVGTKKGLVHDRDGSLLHVRRESTEGYVDDFKLSPTSEAARRKRQQLLLEMVEREEEGSDDADDDDDDDDEGGDDDNSVAKTNYDGDFGKD
jgi:hypothetical protein